MKRFLIYAAVAGWQVQMAVECSMKCIHRPVSAPTIKAAAKPATINTTPQCKGSSCPPTPPPLQPR